MMRRPAPDAGVLPRRRGPLAAAAGLLAAALAGPGWGCALEGDDGVLLRSAMNVAYPQALNVLGAVSSARRSGRIDRWRGLDEPTGAAEKRAEHARIAASLGQLRARLAAATPAGAPALSIVLVEPMLWSRLVTRGARLDLAVHVSGPVRGDVVVVTDEPVIASLNDGRLTAGDALALDLVRLYGRPVQVESVRAWPERGDAKRAAAQRPSPNRVAVN
jgi:hypothetical protein